MALSVLPESLQSPRYLLSVDLMSHAGRAACSSRILLDAAGRAGMLLVYKGCVRRWQLSLFPAAFLQHSCTPNLFVQNVFVDTHDLRFPWVAFFASK